MFDLLSVTLRVGYCPILGRTAVKDILRTDLFLMACLWLFKMSDIGGSGFAAFLSGSFGIVLSSDE